MALPLDGPGVDCDLERRGWHSISGASGTSPLVISFNDAAAVTAMVVVQHVHYTLLPCLIFTPVAAI